MKKEAAKLSLKDRVASVFSQYGIYVAFIVICIFFTIVNPVFISPNNLINMVRQVSFNAILGMGMMVVILTGGIDLSVGSVLALSAVVTGSLIRTSAPVMPVIPAIIIGLGVGALCGLFNGFVITRGKLAPFIVTMVMQTAARGITQLYTKGRPMTGLGEKFSFIGSGYALGIPIPIYILAAIVAMTFFILNKTKIGRYLYAVGGNEPAAKASGIKVERIKLFAYTFTGIMSAIVGIMMSARLNSATPVLGVGYEQDAIAAAVIGGTSMEGGRGKVMGTLIGALIIGTITNGLDILNVSPYWQQIIKGAIILIAVLLDKKN